jgi:HEAT repeat protein
VSSRVIRGSLALALGAAACAGSTATRAVELGDWPSLGRAIALRQRAGDLSRSEAATLANAVADRELRTAAPAEAVRRVRDARPCAHELDGALAERMRTRDAAGAEAALARIDGRGLDLDDARVFADASTPPWRALGARALVRSEDASARLHALLDPDPRVRREAARAARDAADLADLRALAEAARLDPEPIVRTEAVRAIAALPTTPGGEVANVLRDLWTAGDDGVKEDVALAWSGSSVWAAGGREALRVIVASGHGPGVIEAAAAVLRRRDVDEDITEAAVGQLARAIESGAPTARLQALAQAPLGRPNLRAAVTKAAGDDDFDVRVAALARLANAADSHALAELEALGQPGSQVAARARFALAGAGDRRVQAWLEQDLSSPAPEDRLGAATALATLGVAARAAPLLADVDPSVRVRAACTILMAARY